MHKEKYTTDCFEMPYFNNMYMISILMTTVVASTEYTLALNEISSFLYFLLSLPVMVSYLLLPEISYYKILIIKNPQIQYYFFKDLLSNRVYMDAIRFYLT